MSEPTSDAIGTDRGTLADGTDRAASDLFAAPLSARVMFCYGPFADGRGCRRHEDGDRAASQQRVPFNPKTPGIAGGPHRERVRAQRRRMYLYWAAQRRSSL